MNKKKKIIVGACAAVCVVGLGTGIFLLKGNKGKEAQELAYVSSVSSMNDMAGVQRLARVVESQKTLDIQKDSDRTVKEVFVKAGDEVDVGTKLFTYDTATLETDLQQAQLDLERADNDMANLKTQIAQLEKEKKNAGEEEQLSYTTQIQSAQMDLKKSEYERKAKEVEMNRLKGQIENSTVNSEMKGVVKSVNNTEGQSSMDMYGSSQAFMTILATGEYRVKGLVNEQNVSEIMAGEKAIIRSRIQEEQVWTGTYTAVDTKNPNNNNSNMMYGTSAQDAAQTTSTSYPFYVELDSSQGLLLGQHVYIERDTGLQDREKGIWLNAAFIADADKKPYIWVEAKNGTLEKRTVVLGTYDEEMMQYKIEKGIKSDDYVAYPQDFLKEGMKTTHDASQATAGSSEEQMPVEEMPVESLPEEGILEEGVPEEGSAEEAAPEDTENNSGGEDGQPEDQVLPQEGENGEGLVSDSNAGDVTSLIPRQETVLDSLKGGGLAI